MNSLVNGQTFGRMGFRDVYKSGRGRRCGVAIGAASTPGVRSLESRAVSSRVTPLGGLLSAEKATESALDCYLPPVEAEGCIVRLFDDEGELCEMVTAWIADGFVVGWFRRHLDWTTRALANRSILCVLCKPDMKGILNL